jgi:hypothetical protein
LKIEFNFDTCVILININIEKMEHAATL